MIDGVDYRKVDGIRAVLFSARQQTSDPVLIEALTVAIDELQDVLVAVVRDAVQDEHAPPPRPIPSLPTPEQRHAQLMDTIRCIAVAGIA